MSDRQSIDELFSSLVHPLIAAGIPIDVETMVLSAMMPGQRPHSYRPVYSYQLGDVGQTGSVNAFTATEFSVCAAMSSVMALADQRPIGGRFTWLIAAKLMGVPGADDLPRIRIAVPAGDVVLGLVCWSVALYVVARLRAVVQTKRGTNPLIVGCALLGASEVFDLLGSADPGTPNDTLGIREDSAVCLGARSLVAGGIGLVPAQLVHRQHCDRFVPVGEGIRNGHD